ncbi:unnamed protein product, partial [marine sediment metagenome]
LVVLIFTAAIENNAENKMDTTTDTKNDQMELENDDHDKKIDNKDDEFKNKALKCTITKMKQDKLRKWREETMLTLQEGLANYNGGHKTAKALTVIETELASVTMILASLEEKVNKRANIQHYGQQQHDGTTTITTISSNQIIANNPNTTSISSSLSTPNTDNPADAAVKISTTKSLPPISSLDTNQNSQQLNTNSMLSSTSTSSSTNDLDIVSNNLPKEEIIIPKAVIDSPKKTIQDKVSKNINHKPKSLLLNTAAVADNKQDIEFQNELKSLITSTREYIDTLERLNREL